MHTKHFYFDLLERSLWTFVQGFGATMIAQQDITWLSLKVGAIAGFLAVCKAVTASQIGKPETAALPDPPA